MRIIFKSTLYKYFNRHFIDDRFVRENTVIPNNLMGVTRKACRKRRKYLSRASMLTARLYWMSKIAFYYKSDFEADEVFTIKNTLSIIKSGGTYAEIPYSKELYNKIRKVVHDAIKGKYLKSSMKLPLDEQSQERMRLASQTLLDAIEEFVHYNGNNHTLYDTPNSNMFTLEAGEGLINRINNIRNL